MTTRKFTDKNGNEWSWEETPEVKKAIEELHNENRFAGNYEGPLYAPHPEIKNGQKN